MPFQITEEDVLAVMGYTDISKARKPVRKILEYEFNRAPSLTDPWGGVVEVGLHNIEGDVVTLTDGVALEGERLRKILRKSSIAAIMLVTAGKKFTHASREYVASGKLSNALVIDAIGTAYVIDCQKHLTELIYKDVVQRGYGTSMRYGPGYTGWHFDDQKKLFHYFDDDSVPVEITHGIMMIPEKSLLGLLGLEEGKVQAAPEIVACRICDMADCAMRKESFRG